MNVGIVVFPGSNCDRDMHHVLRDVIGYNVQYLWHDSTIPDNIDCIVLPGGFSYGDRLRAGIIAAHSPIIRDIKKMAERGMPILGVCNGFQILVESGLLPGALLKNESLNFMCNWSHITVKNNNTAFTKKLQIQQKIPIPIANGQGRYYADQNTIQSMQQNNQIVFQYDTQVNGSVLDIAGVCNETGNVVGMMPHPERAAEQEINPFANTASKLILESVSSWWEGIHN